MQAKYRPCYTSAFSVRNEQCGVCTFCTSWGIQFHWVLPCSQASSQECVPGREPLQSSQTSWSLVFFDTNAAFLGKEVGMDLKTCPGLNKVVRIFAELPRCGFLASGCEAWCGIAFTCCSNIAHIPELYKLSRVLKHDSAWGWMCFAVRAYFILLDLVLTVPTPICLFCW